MLELIYSNDDGIYRRENGAWTPVNTDAPQPTIDDMEWLDVLPAFVPIFDDKIASQDSISRSEAAEYAAPVDQTQPTA